jgi:hypothetical protein
MKIIEFIEKVLADKSPEQHILSLGVISETEAQKLKNLTGLDLNNYERILDNFAIKHALNKHGHAGVEKLRGQIAISKEDFEHIPEIIENPDKIETGEKNRRNADLLKYTKNINEKVVYVEEIRKGRKQLALQTLYKQKIR